MVPQPSDEHALHRAAVGGDRGAAEALVDSTYRGVYAALFRMTGGDEELAADLTQETYRKAWRALAKFDGRAKLSTWLYRIAYTTFLNHLRRPRPVQVEDAAVDPPDPAPSLQERLESADAARHLRQAVIGLPDSLRFTVTARFWGDLSAREIGRLEGISRIAVHKRLRKAYTLLQAALEDLS